MVVLYRERYILDIDKNIEDIIIHIYREIQDKVFHIRVVNGKGAMALG